MANKTIKQLTPLGSRALASDEFEIQRQSDSTTKKLSLVQLMAGEVDARTEQDELTRESSGLLPNGSLTPLNDSWYLRDEDMNAGFTDRAGTTFNVDKSLSNYIRALDSRVRQLSSVKNVNSLIATFKSPASANGVFYTFGYYEAPTTHAALTQANLSVSYGSANNAYGAHVFVVAKQSGAASGGSSGTARIKVKGTTISDLGIRTSNDTVILVADVMGLTKDKYLETNKRFIGAVTISIEPTGNHTTYAATFNYGFAAPNRMDNIGKVRVDTFDATGHSSVSDTSFNIQLLKHDGKGWTYSAASFEAGGTVLCDMNNDYVVEKNITASKYFKYKRTIPIAATRGALPDDNDIGVFQNDGVVARITTGVNGSVTYCDLKVTYLNV